MKVSEISEKLQLGIAAGAEGLANDVRRCYIGDLLSLAMARVEEGTVWITIQTNINIVAVASLAEAACIIIADGFVPDENTVGKANEVGVPVLTTDKTAYEVAKNLAELGI